MRLPPSNTDNEEIMRLVKEAQARFDALSPEEQRAHRREQAISFVYGNLMDCAPHITREEVSAAYDRSH